MTYRKPPPLPDACTNIEFVEWIDRTFRERMERGFSRGPWRHLDFEEAWQQVVLVIWREGRVPSDYVNSEQVSAMLTNFLAHVFRRMVLPKKVLRHTEGLIVGRAYARAFSQMEDEQLRSVLASAARTRSRQTTTPDLGLSSGWLQDALDTLSEQQRAAIETCVLADMRISRAAEIVGTTVNSLNRSRYDALRKVRRYYEENVA